MSFLGGKVAFWLVLGAGLAAGCSRSENGPAETRNTPPPVEGPQQLVETPAGTVQLADASDGRQAQTSKHGKHGDGETKSGSHTKKGDSDHLFTNVTVLRIEMEISRSGMNLLRRTGWGPGQERPVAKATVREGGVIYTNVAVHLKGAAGSFRSVDDKPAMTLNFDKFVPDQSFHGLHKISLNNSVQDPSFVSEKIAREMFLAAGVPVPRASHALVTLNGRDLGLFVLLEGANKQFLKRYFSNPNGNLYDGGFCQEVNTSLPINSGENPKNDSGLRALLAAMRQQPPSFPRLEKALDVDRFTSMMAIEMMLCHWDGYCQNRNNWRIFHDLDANRMVFIPHGLDQLFGVGRNFDPNSSVKRPAVAGDAARAVLATPQGRARYVERAGQLYTNVYNVEALVRRVDEVSDGITSALSATHPQIANSVQRHARGFKQRLVQRGEGLRRQFDAPVVPSNFGQDNVMLLTRWKAGQVYSGKPQVVQTTDPAGKPLLTIHAGPEGVSSTSWRTEVLLQPGHYQFEGRLRVDGVPADAGDARAGAGLRISKGPMVKKLSGTSAWTVYRYPFVVEDEAADVELICELRASAGNVAFDLGSLRVVRLE